MKNTRYPRDWSHFTRSRACVDLPLPSSPSTTSRRPRTPWFPGAGPTSSLIGGHQLELEDPLDRLAESLHGAGRNRPASVAVGFEP